MSSWVDKHFIILDLLPGDFWDNHRSLVVREHGLIAINNDGNPEVMVPLEEDINASSS